MIPDWETDTLFVSDLLEKKEPDLYAALQKTLKGVPIGVIQGTADIWCRDYMPIQLDQDRFCQFKYAPDYLREYPDLVTLPEKCRLPFMANHQQESIVLDGGNVVASRTKVILTEKIYKENPKIYRPTLRKRLKEIFQAECIFIPKEAEDDVGHSDGVLRFVDENRVLMSDFSIVDPGYGDRVRKVLERNKLEVLTFPMFEEKRTRRKKDEIAPAVGIYINYLRVGNIIVVPGFNRDEEDAKAVARIKEVVPGAVVSQVQCRKLAEKGGVLNCISWTIKRGRAQA
jgi:agmatine/peptidylarginine deiminase